MPVFVTKASGESEPFDVEKIRKTCERAGASKAVASRVAATVEKKVYDGIPTKKILELILKELDRQEPHVAARYDLKGAIMRLGPAGFVFEQLVAELLHDYGYQTAVDETVRGACIYHEIDVVARSRDELAAIEAKYHNAPGIFTGAKDALYVWARYLDLQEGAKKKLCPAFNSIWLVTNTKFSSDATTYAECKGLKLLGWKHPDDRNLRSMLEEKKLYPITVMRTLDPDSLQKLSEAQLMFCKDLVNEGIEDLNKMTGITPKKLRALQAEAKLICGAE
jgi:hypothetical protein